MSLTWSELTGVNAVWRTSTSSSSLLSDPLSTGADTMTFLRLVPFPCFSEALWRPVCILGWRSGTVVARLVADEDNDDEDEDDEDEEDDEEDEDAEAEEEAAEEVVEEVVASAAPSSRTNNFRLMGGAGVFGLAGSTVLGTGTRFERRRPTSPPAVSTGTDAVAASNSGTAP